MDYDACRGLLNLCTQTRDGRDASYAQLLEAWGAMKAAHRFDRLRDLLTGVGEGEGENAVTVESASGDGMVPALSLPTISLSAAPSEDTFKETAKEIAKETPEQTFEGTVRTAKETDAYDAANRQNAQVRRAPGEPGHVAAAAAARMPNATGKAAGKAAAGREEAATVTPTGEGRKRNKSEKPPKEPPPSPPTQPLTGPSSSAMPDAPTAPLAAKTRAAKTEAAKTPAPDPPPAARTLRVLRDLPGLGPIRIRALEKAGFHSLERLRAATLEQLLAVRGMSDPKARHIQSVLAEAILEELDTDATAFLVPVHQGSDEGSGRSSNAGFKAGFITDPGRVLNMEAQDEANARPDDATAWEREAERARQDILALLTCPPAPNFRARLLRELVRFAAGLPVWKAALGGMGDREQERALRRLRKLQDSLADTRAQPDVDRKTQARLAEDLAEASDRLYALSGQPEPARRPEDTHD